MSFGLRWQSTAATPLSAWSVVFQSGVALRFPPQSKIRDCGFAALRLCVKICAADFYFNVTLSAEPV
jgi:hypothetical protein